MADKRKKSRLAIPIGFITIILAIVGLVTAVKGTVNFIKTKAESSSEKATYEKFLEPVVMFDPDTFDDLTKADKSQLLYSAIWSLLRDEDGMNKYAIDQGGIRVPQTDVEEAFTTLYGSEINPASLHSTVDMSGYDISYDSALQAYIIPITGVESAYMPKVVSIEKKGSSVILEVGYINQRAWADMNGDTVSAPEPDKYMKITLREGDKGMYVASIQNTDNVEIASKLVSTTVAADTTAAVTNEAEEETSATGIPVTDESGETVTNESGEVVTEMPSTTAEASESNTEESSAEETTTETTT